MSHEMTYLSDEQERVQKKTFVNWINSYLGKRVPPLRIQSLMEDLRDGTRLLALLEVLSGERLPTERGRILRRPHYLSNCNTALEFLRSKRVSNFDGTNMHKIQGDPYGRGKGFVDIKFTVSFQYKPLLLIRKFKIAVNKTVPQPYG